MSAASPSGPPPKIIANWKTLLAFVPKKWKIALSLSCQIDFGLSIHSEDKDGAIGVFGANEPTRQAIVVGVALVGAGATVDMLFQPKGVDGHRGAAAAGAAAQNAIA